jgi:hypothetical protein
MDCHPKTRFGLCLVSVQTIVSCAISCRDFKSKPLVDRRDAALRIKSPKLGREFEVRNMEEGYDGDIKDWYTAHFISSLESPVKADFGVIVLNQPIELDLAIFRKIWNQG